MLAKGRYTIFSFTLVNLRQEEKMILKRILYGYRTEKMVKGKRYQSEQQGVVEERKGTSLGKGAVLIPAAYANVLRGIFRKHKVQYHTIEVMKA
ncbi:hypothetical protein HYS48_04150 [Candidatus Woesearchaeota archaeon]|nr:hypothetical protein [Candidatus Woesearchaeota archaeon]